MKQFVFLLVLLSIAWCDSFAKTYYYERIAVVKNGVKSISSGDGHFITFTSKGCYDSDRDGISERTGFREYQATANNIVSYYGDSYFGSAYYYFATDLSRLNIKCSDGKTYVYVRKTAPQGVKKSQRNLSNLSNGTSGSSTTIVVAPQTPALYPSSSPSSASSSSSSSSSQARYGYYTCMTCYGTGKCPICQGRHSYNNPYTGNTIVCTQCNDRGQCPSCNGTGKKYGIIK